MKRLAYTLCLLAWGALVPAQAQQNELNLMAGPEGSTAYAVVEDIAGIARECGLSPNVNATSGALDNILAVRNNRYTQFGIIQADVINFLRTFETVDPKIAETLKGIALGFPLYSEEIHLVARPGIESLNDLNGQRVSIGAQSSGTFLTGTVLLDLTGVVPAEKRTLDVTASLDALLAGEIDAFFFVDGVPSNVFEGRDIPIGAIKLVDLEGPLVNAVYESTVIEGGTYDFAPLDVKTPKVGSVMITYDYVPSGRNAYHSRNCQLISDITRLVHDNIADLATIGHPKWVEVDPNATFDDLELSRCAIRALEPSYEPICR